jgi:hypothetical protein
MQGAIMTNMDIAQQRLYTQRIASPTFENPVDVVRWFGAVQAQDYYGAMWAIGLRMRNTVEADIDQAMADGVILRTHVMRPTWHFVTPADIRWLLALTGPRVNVASAYYYRIAELDDALFTKSNAVLAKALQGGRQLTRPELATALQQASIAVDDLQRLGHIIMHAELDGIICSGARRGKQFTYALLDERVPQTRPGSLDVDRDEALAEFARRYFTGHGPATLQDFVWWSGLTAADAKAGLEMVKSQLIQETFDGKAYWLSPSSILSLEDSPTEKVVSPMAYLLPSYDEYTVAYKDRSAVLDAAYANQAGNGIFNPIIAVDGQIVGTWKRTLTKDTVVITPSLFTSLSEDQNQAIAAAIERYSRFIGKSVK